MSLFGSRGDPPPQPPAPAPAQPGGIPAHAQERLREMRGTPQQRGMFTSDLGISEFLLVKKAGFEPLGLVVGSSIYHIGFQQTNWSKNEEMTVLSQAMYRARDLAMTRMEMEADALAADGIVGVRLELGRTWDEVAEFIAIGTAVKSRDGQSYRAPNGKPFTSDLSGQDFFLLRSSGYCPVGLVMGSCVYHIAQQSLRQAWKMMGQNFEMADFTQGIYDARELAMERMQHEGKQLGCEGIVGVQVREASHLWESHVIEYLALGTAIVSRPPCQPDAVSAHLPMPGLALTMNDVPRGPGD